MNDKPKQIKISLGTRREAIEEIAQPDKRSVSETVCLLLDIILEKSDTIKELAEVQRRTFLDMAGLLFEDPEAGYAAAEFLRAIASRQKITDATCIKVARALDIDPESILLVRNCVRDKQPNGR